ncbi:hypothetical protein K439DRAFT_1542218 [Ramaria rubella]|nr:hypothetical protein K439DRAFT_1542218 [Ramaria rubella]
MVEEELGLTDDKDDDEDDEGSNDEEEEEEEEGNDSDEDELTHIGPGPKLIEDDAVVVLPGLRTLDSGSIERGRDCVLAKPAQTVSKRVEEISNVSKIISRVHSYHSYYKLYGQTQEPQIKFMHLVYPGSGLPETRTINDKYSTSVNGGFHPDPLRESGKVQSPKPPTKSGAESPEMEGTLPEVGGSFSDPKAALPEAKTLLWTL